MRYLLTVTRNDLRIIFSDSAVWFTVLIFPALFIVVIGVATGVFFVNRQVVADVLDSDHSATSQQMVAQLQTLNPKVTFCPSSQCSVGSLDSEEAAGRLRDGVTQALIEIPSDFEANLLSGREVAIVYRSNEDVKTVGPILNSLQTVAQSIGGAAVAARVAVKVIEESSLLSLSGKPDQADFVQGVYDRAAAMWVNKPATVAYHESRQPGHLDFAEALAHNTFGQSMPGMGIYAVMVNVLYGLTAIIEERKTGTLQRLLVLPVRRGAILGGKMLTRFLMGMLAFAASFAVGTLLGVRLSDWFAALLVMIAFTINMTALTFLLAALLRTEETARSLVSLLALLLTAVGGAFWPLEIVPQWVRVLGHISPIAWAMDGFTSLIFYKGDVHSVLLPVAVLLGTAVVLFALAVSRFRFE
jgi:ABC-2 type transport system permease protein